MNLLTRVLAMLVAASRAWWRRFAIANTAGKVFWGAVPLLGFCMLCALAQAALPGTAVSPTPTPALVLQRGEAVMEDTGAPGPTEAVPEPVVTIEIATEAPPTPTSVPSPVPPSATAVPPSATPVPPSPSTAPTSPAADAYPVMPSGLQQARVGEVVDGDTLNVEVDGQDATVRMIGIDTPETRDPRKPVQCFGREASAQAVKLLQGQTVLLEPDPSQQERDRFQRLLRYVWLPDGKLFNLEMIVGGFAHEYTFEVPYKYQAVFQKAEQDARSRGWGFWAATTCNGNTEQAADVAAPAPAASPTERAATQPAIPTAQDVGAAPCQPGQIKGNRNSDIYHAPGQRDYARTYANVECFDTEAEAEAAGYRKAQR